jgi:photosystem II stability/assembly factor-like uncharacterized protein
MVQARYLAIALLIACGSTSTPTTTPALVATGDWQVSPTEPYPGKQDDLVFVSPRVGFYGNGAGKLFRTDDGGGSWRMVLEHKGTFIRAVGFLDDKRGFAGNLGPDAFPGVTDTELLYRTDDGGATWAPVALPDAAGARGVCAIDVLAVDAVNSGHRLHKELVHVGGRVGGPAALFRSDDGGGSWARLALPADVAMILDIHFLDVSTGFVFAGDDPDVSKSHGLIARTTDAGRSWQIVYRSKRPFELLWKGAFPSRQIGYASLQNYSAEAAADPDAGKQSPPITAVADRFVVKTVDGGATWRELPMVSDAKVQELGIGFVDDRHGWVGASPHSFETVDGGATWKPVETMPKATNKIRVVRDPGGQGVDVWAIGVDVRHLRLTPAH